MPTLPDSGVSFTVQTNGQTLIVAAGPSASALTAPLYSNAAVSSAVTLPHTITSDTTYYLPLDWANVPLYISVKQPDGTEIWGKTQLVGGVTIAPLPSAAQVAADVRAPTFSYRSGHYYISGQATVTTTATCTLDHLRLHPYVVPSTLSIAKLGLSVTGAGGAGSVIRLGIYADNGSGYPGALVLDAGAGIDGTSATVQEITLENAQVLDAGLYWFGGVGQVGTAATVRTFATPGNNSPMPMSYGTSAPTTALTAGGYVQQSGASGALPATFTSTVTTIDSVSAYRVFFKTS